jgi:hypothetical protein
MRKELFILMAALLITGSAFGVTAHWDPNQNSDNRDMLDPNNWTTDPAGATGHGIANAGDLAPVLDGNWTYGKKMFVGTHDLGELIMLGGLLDVSPLEIGGDYWSNKDGDDNTIAYGHTGIMTLEAGTVNAGSTYIGYGNVGRLNINGGTFNGGVFVVVGNESYDRLMCSEDGITGFFIPFRGSGEISMTGGTFNCEHINVARDKRCAGSVQLNGDASMIVYDDDAADPAASYFRIGHPEAVASLRIEEAATLKAGSISLLAPTSVEFVLDESSLSSSRIDIYDYDEGDTFTLDANDVTITAEISLSFVDKPIPNTSFDLISSVTDLNQEDGLLDNLSQESADAGWSLAVVSDGSGGTILQATYAPTFETCEEVISAGFARNGDFDEDCNVDFTDFAEMATNWLLSNNPDSTEFTPNW